MSFFSIFAFLSTAGEHTSTAAIALRYRANNIQLSQIDTATRDVIPRAE
jgi:hypothetical protein